MAPQEKNSAEKKRSDLHKQIRERTVGYIAAAFGLVAGLAWNNAVIALIDAVFPASTNSSGIFAKFLYAILLTIIVVAITYQITKFADRETK